MSVATVETLRWQRGRAPGEGIWGIGTVGYKIEVIYISFNLIILFSETGRLSFEEIDAIFETPAAKPVPLSLKIRKAKREREVAERTADGE